MKSLAIIRQCLVYLVVFLTVAALIFYFVVGPPILWRWIAGPPDLGPVVFETIKRRPFPNDALVCNPAICPAKIDVESPDFAVPAAALRDQFLAKISSEPNIEPVAADDSQLTYRFIQRTRFMQFPDTIVVQFRDLPEGKSTVLLYSRSQLGRADKGVNLARVRRWLSLVSGNYQPAGAS